jgi:hypothetical protein
MFSFFKKKSLDDKIALIKQYAKDEQLTFKNANIMYTRVALDVYQWEDAAKYFLNLSLKEKIKEYI